MPKTPHDSRLSFVLDETLLKSDLKMREIHNLIPIFDMGLLCQNVSGHCQKES